MASSLAWYLRRTAWVPALAGRSQRRRGTASTCRATGTGTQPAGQPHLSHRVHSRPGQQQTGRLNHLIQADIRSGALADLTPLAGLKVRLVGVAGLVPERLVITMNQRDPTLADAYRVDLRTGRLQEAVENPGHFVRYLADRRGQVLVATSYNDEGGVRLHHRPDEQTPWREVASYPVEDTVSPIAFSETQERIYVASDHGADRTRLVLLDLATGEEEVVAEDPAGRVDLDEALIDPSSGRFVAARFVEDDVRWVSADPAFRALLAELPADAHNLEVLSRSRDGRRWTIKTSSPTSPGRYYLAEPGRGVLILLSRAYSDLDDYQLAPMEPIRVRARDGLELPGYLMRPIQKVRAPYPTVLIVHGGPWSRDRWDFDLTRQFLASRGYAVLSINFRGSRGFGKQFLQRGRRGFATTMQNDLLDAVDWAVARGLTDPRRVAIFGGSYGGYAAVVAMTDTPGRFACGLDIAGPVDLVKLIQSFPPATRSILKGMWYPFVGDPRIASDREDLVRRSPIFRADAIRAPLLIYQGANDVRVTREQSDALALHLHRRGVPVTYLVAPDAGHRTVSSNRQAIDLAAELFLARCLRGYAAPQAPRWTEQRLKELTVDLDQLAAAHARR